MLHLELNTFNVIKKILSASLFGTTKLLTFGLTCLVSFSLLFCWSIISSSRCQTEKRTSVTMWWSPLVYFLIRLVFWSYGLAIFCVIPILCTCLGFVCQFCMLSSTGYHLFRCNSEEAQHRWLALDFTGISVGLLGVYLPGIHYAFYCLSVRALVFFSLRRFYLLT